MVAQVYVSVGSPSSSAPRTERPVVSAVTGEGLAAAGVATVGAGSVTVTEDVLMTPPTVAVTVPLPLEDWTVSNPPLVIEPTVLIQENVGCGDIALTN